MAFVAAAREDLVVAAVALAAQVDLELLVILEANAVQHNWRLLVVHKLILVAGDLASHPHITAVVAFEVDLEHRAAREAVVPKASPVTVDEVGIVRLCPRALAWLHPRLPLGVCRVLLFRSVTHLLVLVHL